jgi:hypothetical protein
LYAEFVDGHDPASYYFAPSAINFHELYNVTTDYYMMHNIYGRAPLALKDALLAIRTLGNGSEAQGCNLYTTSLLKILLGPG